ncbi:YpoC family protein [Salibacterium aidingense]|uniref:YpoC family protein n=1 Tax=Salibacterium aidingense TaxID=384933 RepID=UPI00041E171E|nr:hypothetical protein [Salibacterium aidingense]
MDELDIPGHLAVSPFYNTALIRDENPRKSKYPFIDEILWHNGVAELPPWEAPLQYIPVLFKEWDEDFSYVETCFSKKDRKTAYPYMIYHIASVISIISWMNHTRVPDVSAPSIGKELEELKRSPSNIGDRIVFVTAKPDHHHSFKQLQSLMIENRKQFAIVKLEEKKRKSGSFNDSRREI